MSATKQLPTILIEGGLTGFYVGSALMAVELMRAHNDSRMVFVVLTSLVCTLVGLLLAQREDSHVNQLLMSVLRPVMGGTSIIMAALCVGLWFENSGLTKIAPMTFAAVISAFCGLGFLALVREPFATLRQRLRRRTI